MIHARLGAVMVPDKSGEETAMLPGKVAVKGWKIDGVARGYPQLKLPELRDWDKWSASSKVLLEKAKGVTISIMPLIDIAHKKTIDLYDWLINKLKNW
jgi:hypothetical protein